MLHFLSDENFNGDIIRGLRLRNAQLDLLRVQDVGLLNVDDPEVLAWAATNNRILLTQDRATMPDFAYERISAGQKMPDIFVLHDSTPIRTIIEELLLLDECSKQEEWFGLVLYLPL